jgi:hypothetical protein
VVSQAQASGPALALQLYTEDLRDAARGCVTLRELVRGLLGLVEPAFKSNHIEFLPLHDAPERRVSGSYWKATTKAKPADQARRTRLIQDIITALRRRHVVVFHVDGDDQYSNAARAEVVKHLDRLRRDIERYVYEAKIGRDPLPRDVALEHVFLPLVPFYSIESWAYANTTLLREELTDPRDLEWLARWTADPGAREDILQIKDETLSIRDRLNEELVRVNRGFPRHDLVALGKSYADTQRRFAASLRIRQGLADSVARPY